MCVFWDEEYEYICRHTKPNPRGQGDYVFCFQATQNSETGVRSPCKKVRYVDRFIDLKPCWSYYTGESCRLSQLNGTWKCCECGTDGNEEWKCSNRKCYPVHEVCYDCTEGKRKKVVEPPAQPAVQAKPAPQQQTLVKSAQTRAAPSSTASSTSTTGARAATNAPSTRQPSNTPRTTRLPARPAGRSNT